MAEIGAEGKSVAETVQSTDNVVSSLSEETFSIADYILADGAAVELLVPIIMRLDQGRWIRSKCQCH